MLSYSTTCGCYLYYNVNTIYNIQYSIQYTVYSIYVYNYINTGMYKV